MRLLLVFLAISSSAVAAQVESATVAELNKQGLAALEKKQYRQAVETLYQAWQLDKNDPEVRVNLARAYNEYGVSLIESNIDESINMLQRAGKFDPANATIKSNVAMAYGRKAQQLFTAKDLKGAEQYLAAGLKWDSESDQLRRHLSDLYTYQGQEYLKNKKLGPAMNRLRSAIKYNGENAAAYFFAGEVYYQNQDLANALACYKKALQFNAEVPGLKDRIDEVSREHQVEGGFRRKEQGIFDLRYDKRKEGVSISKVGRYLEEAYNRVGKMLERYPEYKVVVLFYEKEKFDSIHDGPEWSVGVYDGKIRVPYAENLEEEDWLKRLIFHEYTHVLVRDLAKERCPAWLNEGLAEYMEYAIKPTGYNTRLLQRMVKRDQLVGFGELQGNFLNTDNNLKVALMYLECFSLVRFIVKEYGFETIIEMLKEYGRGRSTQAVFSRQLKLSVEEFEQAWLKFVDKEF